MKNMIDPQGEPWLERALEAWAEDRALSETRAQAIAQAVVHDAAPNLPFEWWQTIFPILRLRSAA